MELQEIKITNYKSLVDLEIKNPNPFTVFAGPNGAGKSNIFEALEFISYYYRFISTDVESMFGGLERIINFNSKSEYYSMKVQLPNYSRTLTNFFNLDNKIDFVYEDDYVENSETLQNHYNKFLFYFTRLFIDKTELNRIRYSSDKKILPDASNTASVLKTILLNPTKKKNF